MTKTTQKIVYLAAISILLLLYSCTNRSQKPEGYTITGYISGLEGKEPRIYLDRSTFFKDDGEKSALIKNGKFEIKGVSHAPELRYLSIPGCQGYLPIFLDNAEYTIKGDSANFMLTEVKGGAVQDEYLPYDLFLKKYEPLLQKLRGDYKLTTNKDSLAEIGRKYKMISEEAGAIESKVFRNNPKSYLATYLAYEEFKNAEIEELDSVIKFFDPSVMNSPYLNTLKERIETLKGIAV
ncbi:MAG: DUF4369 domain-containing protein, partial [Bacteroidales bacterium]